MGDIYLHHKLVPSTARVSPRAFVHLISLLSAMSRAGTWPKIGRTEALAELGLDNRERDDARTPHEVLNELCACRCFVPVGDYIVIGPKIAHLVRNTPPPGWEDGSLRDSLDRTEGPRGG